MPMGWFLCLVFLCVTIKEVFFAHPFIVVPLCRVMVITRDSRGSRNSLLLTFTSISSFNTSTSSGKCAALLHEHSCISTLNTSCLRPPCAMQWKCIVLCLAALQAAVCSGSGPAESCSPQLGSSAAAAAAPTADQRAATAIPGAQDESLREPLTSCHSLPVGTRFGLRVGNAEPVHSGTVHTKPSTNGSE